MQTFDDGRRAGRRVLAALFIAFAACLAATKPAAAVEITCIESSRYGYLYKLFGDDRQKFAAYFGLNATELPAPQTCRAALITGKIEPKDIDALKLIDIIGQNGGWLDTLYLNSPGGNVGDGILLALLTRDFWLKTRVAPQGKSFVYEPDFGPPAGKNPPDPARLAFDNAAATVPTPTEGARPPSPGPDESGTPDPNRRSRTRCASACTFTLAAGIDRRGIALVHRPHNTIDSIRGHGLGGEAAETRMMALYRKMDVGDAFVAATRATAAKIVTPVVISRYPRFIGDTLFERCKSDGAQLDDLAALLRSATNARGADLALEGDNNLGGALVKVERRRQDVAQCTAVLHEKERREAFQRYCPPGCNQSAVRAKIVAEFKELVK